MTPRGAGRAVRHLSDLRRRSHSRAHRECALHDAPVTQDQAGVGHRRELGVVGHEHERGAAAGVDRAQQIHDVAAVRGVEVPGRFVGEDDFGVVGQCTGERHALLLAARQL
jgi:hypothetical protein